MSSEESLMTTTDDLEGDVLQADMGGDGSAELGMQEPFPVGGDMLPVPETQKPCNNLVPEIQKPYVYTNAHYN